MQRDMPMYKKSELFTENVFGKYYKSQNFLQNFLVLKSIVKRSHHFLL